MLKLRCLALLAEIIVTLLGPVSSAHAAPPARRPLTLFILRHAEKLNSTDTSPLTATGFRYARGLAIRLRNRGVNRVITCKLLRCKETAAPLVHAIQRRHPGFRPGLLPGTSVAAVKRSLLRLPLHSVALVVAQSTYIPELIRALSGANVTGERDRYYVIYRLVRRRGGRYPFVFHHGPIWTPAPAVRHRPAR